MNIILASSLRAAALATSLLLLPVVTPANNSAPVDRASQLLSANGTLSIKAAEPYVEVGTFRIAVAGKLGQPTERLADGTWIYQNFCVEESAAIGALVVRFDAKGQVKEMSLMAPVMVAGLRTALQASEARIVAANQARR